ncbi:hypothetical protein EV421DRAFT_885274 [Armillaria borealis]|uniref:Secreted protein n=1 Tax=Armillaria borealis TaxID=47425 RepID=A0AA39MZ44_9AGAR|nr:hypothetical protein EV421DRAFT_885274 [Armillaria borealis]
MLPMQGWCLHQIKFLLSVFPPSVSILFSASHLHPKSNNYSVFWWSCRPTRCTNASKRSRLLLYVYDVETKGGMSDRRLRTHSTFALPGTTQRCPCSRTPACIGLTDARGDQGSTVRTGFCLPLNTHCWRTTPTRCSATPYLASFDLLIGCQALSFTVTPPLLLSIHPILSSHPFSIYSSPYNPAPRIIASLLPDLKMPGISCPLHVDDIFIVFIHPSLFLFSSALYRVSATLA